MGKSYSKVNSEDLLVKSPDNCDDSLFNDYFKLIDKVQMKCFEDNKLNIVNINVALEEKNFDMFKPSRRLINKKLKFIYWKDHLINYLVKQRDNMNHEWASDLIEYILHFYIK